MKTPLQTDPVATRNVGGADALADTTSRNVAVGRVKQQLRQSDGGSRQGTILNALPAQIALIDADGVIISVNETWRQFATANLMPDADAGLGSNYLEVCDHASGDASAEAPVVAAGIRAVLSGQEETFSIEYPCHSPVEKRWFLLTVSPLLTGQPVGAVVMHFDVTARRAAESALAELSLRTDRRERMLSSLLSSIQDFAYFFDRQGRFLFANQPLLDLWGIPLESAVGKTFSDLGYPAVLAAHLQQQVEQVFETQQNVTDETAYVSPDGHEGYYEYIFSPVVGPDGTTEFVVGSTRDVTERKRAENILRESEARFAAAFEHAPIAIALVSPTGRWLRVNQSLCALLGYTEDEMLAFNVVDNTHPDDRALSLENIRRTIASEERAFLIEKRYVRKSGSIVNALLGISLIRDDEGRPLYFVSQIQDITEQKAAKANLEESEGRDRALVDWSPDPIAVSRDGEVLFVNPAAVRLIGASDKSELLGRQIYDFIHPDSIEMARERTTQNSAEGGVLPLIEERFVRLDGTVVDVEVQGRSIIFNGLPAMFSSLRDVTERKHAESDLRESNQKFQQLADNITDVFWIRSADMAEVQYISPAFEKIWGRSVASLQADPHEWSDFVVAEDRDRVLASFASLQRDSKPIDLEYRIARPDGEVRWVRTRGFRVRDEAGTPIRNIGIITDITERQRALAELQASELELRKQSAELSIERSRLVAAQRVAKVGSWETNLAAMTVVWSDETHRMFETDPLTTSPTHPAFLAAVHPDDRQMVEDAFIRSLDKHTPCSIEHRILTPSGKVRFVEERWQVVFDASGDPVKAIGTCQDITERREAEEALRQSQKRLRDVFDGLGPSMFVALLTPDGILVEINRAPLEAAGLRSTDVLGKHFADTPWWSYSTEVNIQLREAIIRAAAGEGSRYDTRTSGMAGEIIDLDFSIEPLRDDSGKVAFLVPSATVITERKAAEQSLRQAQKMEAVGQLAAGVAHEFNNLLQAMMSMNAITRFRSLVPNDTDVVNEMESLIKRGAALTQQLLLFSRESVVTKETLDLDEQVRKASLLLRHLIPETITIVVETWPETLSIDGDSGQIQQVLLNLAINARDAMPDGGTLTLRTGRDGADVFQEVEDTGQGMSAATRLRLFEPFFTTKGPGKGTGLGLAVAQGIVEQHEGRIEVYSNPDRGSRFRVIFPATLSRAAPPIQVEDSGALPQGSGRVLVVEDDPSVREGIAALLELIGYEVTVVGSAEEAIALTFDHAPDVLLSDVSLPGMTGPVLATHLQSRWPNLNVVLMSGYIEEAMKATALRDGLHFLQKPFELGDLARELQSAMDRKAE